MKPHKSSKCFPSQCDDALLALGCTVDFSAQIRRRGTTLAEESGEDRLNERAEDDLSTTGLRKGHPQDKDEFEGVVEC